VVITKAINRISLEILRCVYQKDRRARCVVVPDSGTVSAVPFDIQIVNDLVADMAAVDLLKQWKYETSVRAILAESFRQRARYVCQPTSFRERHSLRREYSNAQTFLASALLEIERSTYKNWSKP
jgi:hypothetical protein